MSRFIVCLSLLALAALPSTVQADHNPRDLGQPAAIGVGYLYGVVYDVSGVPIPTATVVSPGMNISLGGQGSYVGRFTSDARYFVTIAAPGYVTQQTSFILRAGTMSNVNFTLTKP